MGDAKTLSVSADYLVRGVVYALEQSGRLLRDAKALYNIGSYGTAIAVAAFAREELGRSDIVLDLWRKAISGQTVTVQEIKERCDDHVEKQRRAVRSITMMTDCDAGLGKLLNTRSQADLHSEERKAADEQVKGIDETLRKRAPNERHELRTRGLYVDPDESGEEWRLPKDITQEQAYRFLTDAANDYAVACQIVEPQLHVVDDARFYEALANWPECPTLPPTPPAWLHRQD
jgi:AbiV family abortive infection protein